MSRPIASHELELLATGSWILGTGGGGSPYSSYLSMKNFYNDGGSVELLDAEELADDDLVAVLSTMGAPLVFQERMTDPAFALKPLRIMEDYLGKRFRAVMTVEIGGSAITLSIGQLTPFATKPYSRRRSIHSKTTTSFT